MQKLKALIEKTIEDMLTGDDELPCGDGGFPAGPKIVVCQRGFVYAGDVESHGDYVVIKNAVNIRKWGTTRGLGELAERGSLPDTKADSSGTVRVHRYSVVSMIDCKERIHATA